MYEIMKNVKSTVPRIVNKQIEKKKEFKYH